MTDNLRVHHTEIVQTEIQRGGHHVLFRPAYSPDFAPVELAFSKIKAFIRAHKYEINKDNMELYIYHAIMSITSDDCRGWFEKCHYH
jgi:transposase